MICISRSTCSITSWWLSSSLFFVELYSKTSPLLYLLLGGPVQLHKSTSTIFDLQVKVYLLHCFLVAFLQCFFWGLYRKTSPLLYLCLGGPVQLHKSSSTIFDLQLKVYLLHCFLVAFLQCFLGGTVQQDRYFAVPLSWWTSPATQVL
jgi:hypothetical protein